MNLTLRIFCMAIGSLLFFSLTYKLIKRQIDESSSVLWFLVGLVTFIAGIVPDLINRLAVFVGVDYPPTLLFLVSTIFLMVICFKSSIDISKAEKRINETAIVVSLLKEENERLRKQIEKDLL